MEAYKQSKRLRFLVFLASEVCFCCDAASCWVNTGCGGAFCSSFFTSSCTTSGSAFKCCGSECLNAPASASKTCKDACCWGDSGAPTGVSTQINPDLMNGEEINMQAGSGQACYRLVFGTVVEQSDGISGTSTCTNVNYKYSLGTYRRTVGQIWSDYDNGDGTCNKGGGRQTELHVQVNPSVTGSGHIKVEEDPTCYYKITLTLPVLPASAVTTGGSGDSNNTEVTSISTTTTTTAQASCTLVSTGVAKPEKWLNSFKGKGLHACYLAVLADAQCAKDYFTYVTRGDASCGCKMAGSFSLRQDGNADYYQMNVGNQMTCVLPTVLSSTAADDDSGSISAGTIVAAVVGSLVVICGFCFFVCYICFAKQSPASAAPAVVAPVPATPAVTPAPAVPAIPTVAPSSEPLPEWADRSIVPGYWRHRHLDQDFDEKFDVPEKFRAELQKLLDVTWKGKRTRDRSGKMPTGVRLVKAHRVENRELWQKYLAARKQLAQTRTIGVQPVNELDGNPLSGFVKTSEALDQNYLDRLITPLNELYLWHGTSPDGAVGISKDGFRLSHAGAHGLMFGRGAYFAECCSKSDEYASDDKGGLYQGMYALLLCRVLCGEMFRVTQAASREPGKIESALTGGQYDSVLGDREASAGTYREFVVPREDRIYPEYVVLYERLYADG